MRSVISKLFIGQIARLQRSFTFEDVKKYNELTIDYNDVYHPDTETWRRHYDRPVVPGILAEGLINQVISDELPGGPCVLLQKELIFSHPVHIGDEITAELEIVDINYQRNWITQKVTCFNQFRCEVIKGQVVIMLI